MTETFAYDLLRRGAEQVVIKPRGHSMEPVIMDRQQVTITALHDDDVLAVGDVVLARVRGNIYLHKITAIDGNRIQISNNHGNVNGWTHRDRIAGIAFLCSCCGHKCNPGTRGRRCGVCGHRCSGKTGGMA
jgi:hypothetical protein